MDRYGTIRFEPLLLQLNKLFIYTNNKVIVKKSYTNIVDE